MEWSSAVTISRYKTVSSANKRISLDKSLHKSLIKRRKSRGPRTLPWGTPDVTGFNDDEQPPTTTFCFRFERKFCITFTTFEFIANVLSFSIKMACETRSKALLKSRKMASTCFFLSIDWHKSCSKAVACVSQDRFLENPCCCGARRLFERRCEIMLEYRICSKTLHDKEVKETGL